MKGQKILKVTGIIMIVISAFSMVNLIVGGAALMSDGAVDLLHATGNRLLYTIAYTAISSWFNFHLLLFLMIAIISCGTAGINGVRYCNKPEKASGCIAWSVVAIIFTILALILKYYMRGEVFQIFNYFNIVNIVRGLIIPAVYLYGAILNRKDIDFFGMFFAPLEEDQSKK